MQRHDDPMMIVKACTACHVVKPLDAFNIWTRASDGRQDRCRDCCKAWYREHGVVHRANVKVNRTAALLKVQGHLMEYLLLHPCIDCGESDPVVLDFDHVDPRTKTACISELIRWGCAWRKVQREIEKCEVRCANCHRRRTAMQFGSWRYALQALR